MIKNTGLLKLFHFCNFLLEQCNQDTLYGCYVCPINLQVKTFTAGPRESQNKLFEDKLCFEIFKHYSTFNEYRKIINFCILTLIIFCTFNLVSIRLVVLSTICFVFFSICNLSTFCPNDLLSLCPFV